MCCHGNVASADNWWVLLLQVIERYHEADSPKCFRVDVAFGEKGVRWHNENGPLIEWGEGRMGNVSLEWIYHD